MSNDPEAIVIATNTSSFGPGAAAAEQQLLSSRMRARELGMWIVQSAPSGVSAIVDPEARVVARTVLYEATILHGAIGLAQPRTPFSRWGEGPIVVLAGGVALLLLKAPRSGRGRRQGA